MVAMALNLPTIRPNNQATAGISNPLQQAMDTSSLLRHTATNSPLLSSIAGITLRRRHSMVADQDWPP